MTRAVVFFAAFGVGVAHADTATLERKGREFFARGNYAAAVDIFAQLYAETLHPTYQRNIGRCYQNMNRPDEALNAFREYLRRAPDLAPVEISEIRGYMAELEHMKEAALPAASAPESESRGESETESEPTPRSDHIPTAVEQVDTAPPEVSSHSDRRYAVYALAGGALLGGIAGGVGLWGHNQASQDYNRGFDDGLCVGADQPLALETDLTCRSARDRRDTYRTLTVISFSAGAVLLGASLIVAIWPESDAVAPASNGQLRAQHCGPGPGDLGLGCAWVF